jgi:ferritin
MLSDKIEKAMNEQINAEFFSSYLYLSMSCYFADKGLPGAANWMPMQAQEELFHGMKLLDFVNERGGKITLKAIEAPQVEWKSTLAVFENVLSRAKGHRPDQRSGQSGA